MTFWFTADQHFRHTNIIKYCNRPFKDIDEMTETIIGNHNRLVKPNDIVYHIGDFMFGRSIATEFDRQGEKVPPNSAPDRVITTLHDLLQRLHGTKILILGSHDKLSERQYEEAGFKRVHRFLKIPDLNIVMIHNPADIGKLHYGGVREPDKIYLCAHTHQHFDRKGNVFNVGVDVRKFRPVSLDEILIEMRGKSYLAQHLELIKRVEEFEHSAHNCGRICGFCRLFLEGFSRPNGYSSFMPA